MPIKTDPTRPDAPFAIALRGLALAGLLWAAAALGACGTAPPEDAGPVGPMPSGPAPTEKAPSGPAPAEKTPSGDAPGAATADEAGVPVTGPRETVTAHRYMVASANPLASRTGLDILHAGGSAVDAAIAMQMVLALVEPQSSGLGGGGFMMHFDAATGAISAYEGREAAPAAVTETLFLKADGTPMARDDYRVGGISVAVPGTLRLLEMAHRAHGKLPWKALFAPAIRMARDGFKVSPRLHASISDDRFLGESRTAAPYFFTGDGAPLPVGARLRNPALADTLRAIAEGGADAFYSGPIAADIAAAVAGDGKRAGAMTVADIAAYRAKKRRQLCGPYRVWLVCGFGPPTAGGVTTLMTLSMLERFDLVALGPDSVEAAHLIGEATRLANADRLRYVADPDFVDVPIAGLLDPGYLAERSELIRSDRAMATVRAGRPDGAERHGLAPGPEGRHPSTTHLSVIDAAGNAVAMTSSIGGAFGSRIMVRGFMLNNHATDFTAEPRDEAGRPRVNRPGPNKRPRSAQSPTFVFDGSGRLALAVGSPGGPRIIAYVVKTLIGVLDWGLDVQAAIALPNIAHRRGHLEIERGTSLAEKADALRALGHRVRLRTMTSGIQAVGVKDGVLVGGADPRREGVALGD